MADSSLTDADVTVLHIKIRLDIGQPDDAVYGFVFPVSATLDKIKATLFKSVSQLQNEAHNDYYLALHDGTPLNVEFYKLTQVEPTLNSLATHAEGNEMNLLLRKTDSIVLPSPKPTGKGSGRGARSSSAEDRESVLQAREAQVQAKEDKFQHAREEMIRLEAQVLAIKSKMEALVVAERKREDEFRRKVGLVVTTVKVREQELERREADIRSRELALLQREQVVQRREKELLQLQQRSEAEVETEGVMSAEEEEELNGKKGRSKHVSVKKKAGGGFKLDIRLGSIIVATDTEKRPTSPRSREKEDSPRTSDTLSPRTSSQAGLSGSGLHNLNRNGAEAAQAVNRGTLKVEKAPDHIPSSPAQPSEDISALAPPVDATNDLVQPKAEGEVLVQGSSIGSRKTMRWEEQMQEQAKMLKMIEAIETVPAKDSAEVNAVAVKEDAVDNSASDEDDEHLEDIIVKDDADLELHGEDSQILSVIQRAHEARDQLARTGNSYTTRNPRSASREAIAEYTATRDSDTPRGEFTSNTFADRSSFHQKKRLSTAAETTSAFATVRKPPEATIEEENSGVKRRDWVRHRQMQPQNLGDIAVQYEQLRQRSEMSSPKNPGSPYPLNESGRRRARRSATAPAIIIPNDNNKTPSSPERAGSSLADLLKQEKERNLNNGSRKDKSSTLPSKPPAALKKTTSPSLARRSLRRGEKSKDKKKEKKKEGKETTKTKRPPSPRTAINASTFQDGQKQDAHLPEETVSAAETGEPQHLYKVVAIKSHKVKASKRVGEIYEELAFKKGDIILVTLLDEGGNMAYGVLSSSPGSLEPSAATQGWFPLPFVELVSPEKGDLPTEDTL